MFYPNLPKRILDKLEIITDLKPSRAKLEGYSGANLGNMGTIRLNCRQGNGGSAQAVKFFVTRVGKTPILRLKHSLIFELIYFQKGVYTDTSNTANQDVDTVSRMKDLRYDYRQLYKKGEKHLPLGEHMGDPKQGFMKLFPKQFEGIGLLPGEYNIDMKPDAAPVHLPLKNIPDIHHQLLHCEISPLQQ